MVNTSEVMANFGKVSDVQIPVKVYYDTIDEYGWTKGHIEILPSAGQDCSYVYVFEAKVYKVPSHNGIDGGRISKLSVGDIYDDIEVIGFDRGWYLKPQCQQEYVALDALLKTFDTHI